MQKFDVYKLDGSTLRVFLSVCETGSVSRTAHLFDVNQSTISYTLEKMRSAIGEQLFVKVGRGIAPTEKALSIIPDVQDILAKMEGLLEAERYDPSKETSPVRVAIPTPSLVPTMKKFYLILQLVAPSLEFRLIRLAPRERMAEMLSEGEADVAIALNVVNAPKFLSTTYFGEDELVVFYDPASRDPITSLGDYCASRHAVAGFGGSGKSVVELALEEQGLVREIGFVAPTASSLADFIVGTDLIATMPMRLAKGAFARLSYCRPPLTLPKLTYHLAWHRRFEHSGRNAWIRRSLLESREQFGEASAPRTPDRLSFG